MHNARLAKLLTYSGTLPFIFCAGATMQGMHIEVAALDYGAVISSFLCGIHWAIYLFFSDRCPRNLFITSNIIALIAWLTLSLANLHTALLLQSLCFLYLLTLDYRLMKAGILPGWFYTVRRTATAIVVISLSLISLCI